MCWEWTSQIKISAQNTAQLKKSKNSKKCVTVCNLCIMGLSWKTRILWSEQKLCISTNLRWEMEKVEKEVKGCKISDQGIASTFPDIFMVKWKDRMCSKIMSNVNFTLYIYNGSLMLMTTCNKRLRQLFSRSRSREHRLLWKVAPATCWILL